MPPDLVQYRGPLQPRSARLGRHGISPPNFCHAELKKKRSTDFLSTDKICHKCSERNNKDEIHGETALAVDRTSEKAWCPLVPDFLPKKSQISAILGVLTPRLF